MKLRLIGLLCAFSFACVGQGLAPDASIDWDMRQTDAPTPDSLARIINRRYTHPREKVRAAYAWIVSHVAYNTGKAKFRTAVFVPDPMDTATVWLSGDEMVARRVMFRRVAVCESYAKLFKVLCDYTGVEAALVQGYARTNTGDRKFRTNHTWNAVQLDSAWRLLDVTWASGHTTWADEFVQAQNDVYFLTPPEVFARDHYPEQLHWALLPQPLKYHEFGRAPFRTKHYYRYGGADQWPARGEVEMAPGDTVEFALRFRDGAKADATAPDAFADTTRYGVWPASVFLEPLDAGSDGLRYRYVAGENIEWIHLLYKGDVVLRYRQKPLPKKTDVLASR